MWNLGVSGWLDLVLWWGSWEFGLGLGGFGWLGGRGDFGEGDWLCWRWVMVMVVVVVVVVGYGVLEMYVCGLGGGRGGMGRGVCVASKICLFCL